MIETRGVELVNGSILNFKQVIFYRKAVSIYRLSALEDVDIKIADNSLLAKF